MPFKATLELFPYILMTDFLRYFIAASLAYVIFWVVFKKYWEHRIIQSKTPGFRKKLSEFGYSMSTVFIFAMIGWVIVTAQRAGYTRIYTEIDEMGWWWFFGSIALMIVLHDTWFYWTHRLMHHPKLFKHVHLVHHRSINPSPWAAYAFHPFEAIIEAGIVPLIVFTIPSHSIALLSFLIYMITRNVQGHLGIEFLPKSFIHNKWLNWHTTTTHHDLHHQKFNANYGLYFTWWDRWGGTEYKGYKDTFETITSRPKGTALLEANSKNHKALLCISLLLFVSGSVHSQSVEGTWQSFHEETAAPLSLIEIKKEGNSIEGKVVKIYLQAWEGTDPICVKCPGRRKGKRVLGMDILWDLEKNGAEWSGGKILDPASGKVYTSKAWLENDTTLKVRGYADRFQLFYRTQTWLLHEKAANPNPISGIWKTIDDTSGQPKSLIELRADEGKISGRILQLFLQPWEGTDPICMQCPGKKKQAKIVGMPILWNFKWSNGQWKDGSILDPGNGKTYSSSIWLEDANTLKVRGFLGPFYRTQSWKRWDADREQLVETTY